MSKIKNNGIRFLHFLYTGILKYNKSRRVTIVNPASQEKLRKITAKVDTVKTNTKGTLGSMEEIFIIYIHSFLEVQNAMKAFFQPFILLEQNKRI